MYPATFSGIPGASARVATSRVATWSRRGSFTAVAVAASFVVTSCGGDALETASPPASSQSPISETEDNGAEDDEAEDDGARSSAAASTDSDNDSPVATTAVISGSIPLPDSPTADSQGSSEPDALPAAPIPPIPPTPETTTSEKPTNDKPTPDPTMPETTTPETTTPEPTTPGTGTITAPADPEAEPSVLSPAVGCRRLTDFVTTEEIDAWFTVNDGVMGGRSSGGPSFGESFLIFSGTINTDGGGFSSIRALLEPNAMADATQVMLRVRSDGRQFKLTFQDRVERTFRLISHQAPIPVTAAGEWATVTVPLDGLNASSAGRQVDTEPFDRAQAEHIGIIISDGVDGPFQLEVDWIDLC